jgi:site-specific DNA-methyltransferase (adenine-specific)
MAKLRAGRNRTITLTPDETVFYANVCKQLTAPATAAQLRNQIIRGDLFVVMNYLPSQFVDLLVVDPPYNLSKFFGHSPFNKMSADHYRQYTERWLEGIAHTLKDDASIYVCCDWQSSLIIGDILKQRFIVQNRITWQREKGRGALNNWKNSMEDIWFATVSKKYKFNVEKIKTRRRVIAPYKTAGRPKDWQTSAYGNFRDTYPSNFWDDISIPYWSMPENTDHPAQKPEKLFAKLILASSDENDLVFDPFAGSGTAAVVARKLNRDFLSVEREAEYCALAQKRLQDALSKHSVQGYSDGVFWERNTLAWQRRRGVADKAPGEDPAF